MTRNRRRLPLLLAAALFAPPLAAMAQPTAAQDDGALRFSAGQASGPFLSGGGGARLAPDAATDRERLPAPPPQTGLRRMGADRFDVGAEHDRDGRAARAPGVSAEFLLAR